MPEREEESAFLAGAHLSAAIKDILCGREIRCAVAFWGKGSSSIFTPKALKDAKIICDVALGGTNPKALVDLGAPIARSYAISKACMRKSICRIAGW